MLSETLSGDVMEPWRTAITTSDEKSIRIRGYDIASLMRRGSFADTIYLLHRSRLPTPEEGRLLDAILTGVSDHGPAAPSAAAARIVASGNRSSLEACIAAGVLAMGDAHGGAAHACMQMIAEGMALVHSQSLAVGGAAQRLVARAKCEHRRIPGMGHRVHTEDPRAAVLFGMARASNLAGEGIAFMQALEQEVRQQIRPMPINIDGALSAVLHDLGFSPESGKLIFIIGRVAGLTAQVLEEYAREKPMRVRIPVAYDGPPAREM